jgi:hypothetical protein
MNGIDQAGSQSVPVSSSSGIVSSTGVTKSSTTVAFWQRQLGLAQVTKLRGNCWRKHGFCINITNFFYPEEALLLYERGFLVVTKTPNGSDCMTKQELYEAVLEVISLSCYLTYARLKVSFEIFGSSIAKAYISQNFIASFDLVVGLHCVST